MLDQDGYTMEGSFFDNLTGFCRPTADCIGQKSPASYSALGMS